jgi:hypothetical protein
MVADAQLDTDNDSYGDACDSDDDGDTVEDSIDNCPLIANPDQSDQDQDGYTPGDLWTGGDACDEERDGDGWSNIEELEVYGTTPTDPDTDDDGICDGPQEPVTAECTYGPDPTPFGDGYRLVFEARAGGASVTETWLPEVGNSVDIIVRLEDAAGNALNFDQDVTFTLYTSDKEGRALNETETSPFGNDSSFDVNDREMTTYTYAGSDFPEAFVTLHSFDFGTEATIEATTTLNDSSVVTGSITMPLDTDHDGVPDFIENENAWCGFDPGNPHSLSSTLLDGDTDMDRSVNNAFLGDDILSRDEWRGVTIDPNADDVDAALIDRLDLCRKTLFVRGSGFANSLDPGTSDPKALKFDLSVDGIIAPGSNGESALKEIDLEVYDVSLLPAYNLPREPPFIDILIVTYDTMNTITLEGNANGFTNHLGSYAWTWDINGASCHGDGEYYGSAVPGCGTYIYHLNTMHYIYNRPYRDERSVMDQTLNQDFDYLLDPLELVEDYRYENGQGPESFRGKTEDIFLENDVLDGDHMMLDWDGDGDSLNYEAGYQFSVFDRDWDGFIENPQWSDPSELLPGIQVLGEYTPQQKITHTEIHEIFHSLGVIDHSADETCLMNSFSNNWSRAGHVSIWAMEQVQVNNGTEY